MHASPSFVPVLKDSSAQLVHVASDVLSAEEMKYLPGLQFVLLAAQDVSALLPTLNSAEAQPVHVASAVLSAEAV